MKKNRHNFNLSASLVVMVSLGAILLAACAPLMSTVQPGVSLEGTSWVLQSYLDPAGQTKQALPDTQVTAKFQDGELNGTDGCNHYFASYEVKGSQITIGQAGSTMMACSPEAIMTQAAEFYTALASVASLKLEGEQLSLMNAQGNAVLVFKASAEPAGLASLAGTSWQVTTISNGKETVASLLAGTEITATFSSDGRLSGSAGCNTYSAGHSVDGAEIKIDPPASTLMMCGEPAGVMEQEAAYLAALEKAASFEGTENELTLRDAGGAMLLQFARQK